MGRGGLFLLLLLLLQLAGSATGTEAPRSQDCRSLTHGTSACPPMDNVIVREGERKSFQLDYDTSKQIEVAKCNLQTGELEHLYTGRPCKLHSLVPDPGISLINQIMTVENAVKANEGIYVVSSLKKKCAVLMNLTVLEKASPDRLPSAGVTPTSNVPTSAGSVVPRSGSGDLTTGLALGVVTVIAAAAIILYLQ